MLGIGARTAARSLREIVTPPDSRRDRPGHNATLISLALRRCDVLYAMFCNQTPTATAA